MVFVQCKSPCPNLGIDPRPAWATNNSTRGSRQSSCPFLSLTELSMKLARTLFLPRPIISGLFILTWQDILPADGQDTPTKAPL